MQMSMSAQEIVITTAWRIPIATIQLVPMNANVLLAMKETERQSVIVSKTDILQIAIHLNFHLASVSNKTDV